MASVLGVPARENYWKARPRGACQDIFFLTTLDRTPDFVKTIYALADSHRYPASDVAVYLQPSQQGACCHCEFTLPYRPDDPREASRMKQLFTVASEALMNQGAYFSRPYGTWAPMMYNRDAQNTITLMKIKGIFDPNNVMNPGRLFGVMTQRYQEDAR